MDLHPYDGKERRYRHTDDDVHEGIQLLTQILGLPTPPPQLGLRYDLSFYSGGIGVLDRLAITLPLQRPQALDVVARLQARGPEDAVADADWRDDFLWLIDDEDNRLPRIAAARFINGNRSEFQSPCDASDAIWFESESDVNAWTALWHTHDMLNYLAYAQG
jgi:hypothetical protein